MRALKAEHEECGERERGISGGWMVDWLSATIVKMFNLPIAGIGLYCELKSNSIEIVLWED